MPNFTKNMKCGLNIQSKIDYRPFVNNSNIDNSKETLQSKVKWIDNCEDDKAKLVTNTDDKDLIEKEDIQAIVSHRNFSNKLSSILKQVFHIHPKDYNFIIKDGAHKHK